MRAEVIAIGDELTTGQRLDTNTQWLSEQLTAIGVDVAFHTTVGDTLQDNVAAFRSAIERVDVVVATGGLGPTADDLSREALAAATGAELVRNKAALDHIAQLFASRGRQMPPRNAVQADFPKGASIIVNEHGTAPGVDMTAERPGRCACRLFALPGVPAELKPMWRNSVRPAILALQAAPRVTLHHRLRCFGAGESAIEAMLPDMIARMREPLVGITVSDAVITLRITASGLNEAACHAAMKPTIDEARAALGDLVFGDEDDELEDAVARVLAERGLTIAIAEWATGGLVAERLNLAGVDAAGVAVSSFGQVAGLLGATFDKQLRPHDSPIASCMADVIRHRANVDVGVGVAAFPPNVDEPAARLAVAIATSTNTCSTEFPCAGHPAILRSRSAKQALNAVRLTLQQRPG